MMIKYHKIYNFIKNMKIIKGNILLIFMKYFSHIQNRNNTILTIKYIYIYS